MIYCQLQQEHLWTTYKQVACVQITHHTKLLVVPSVRLTLSAKIFPAVFAESQDLLMFLEVTSMSAAHV